MASLVALIRYPFVASRALSTSRTITTRAFTVSAVRAHAMAVDSFPVLTDPRESDDTLPTFMVGRKNGFLPRQDPLVELPTEYKELESLLQRMPINLPNGNHGLLHHGAFGDAVRAELPQYDVSGVTNQRVLSALFRDYTFLSSAYLLEPCDISYRKTGNYGLGRDVLPRNIAVPLKIVADKIGAKPFMEYAMSYALYNYKRADPTKPLDFENLRLIRAFAGTASELGFIGNHVSMVQYSGPLVSHTLDLLTSCASHDRQHFDSSLRDLAHTYSIINAEMEDMWTRSDPADYLSFRTFIYGTKNQPQFPRGVLYEGVSAEPLFHRGESGANDSMIPLGDNVLELTEKMPQNPLTEVLRDFREYRPVGHREFLAFIERHAREVEVKRFAVRNANSAALYLAAVDQLRAFRHRHWNFTKAYILKRTTHPVATGGSPIVTWLPNQLGAVLDTMVEVGDELRRDELTEENLHVVDELARRAKVQKRVLAREVNELKVKYENQERVVV